MMTPASGMAVSAAASGTRRLSYRLRLFYRDLRGFCLWAFLFLGPLGAFIPTPGLPTNFRFYYLFLPLGILAFLIGGIRIAAFRQLLIFLPFLAYCFVSTLYTMYTGDDHLQGLGKHPIVRYGIFFCLFLFSLMAGFYGRGRSDHERLSFLMTYLSGFLICTALGFVLYIAYIKGMIGGRLIEMTQVQVMSGYGLKRFSPGSYPNEYGTVCAYALSVWILLYQSRATLRSRLKGPVVSLCTNPYTWVAITIMLLAALYLATTRSAYLGFGFSLLYLFWIRRGLQRKLTYSLLMFGVLMVVLVVAQQFYDVIRVFEQGFTGLAKEGGSSMRRIENYEMLLERLVDAPILGLGFGNFKVDMVHNLYLQILGSVGVVGSVLLVYLIYLSRRSMRAQPILQGDAVELAWVLVHARNIAVIQVVWFGMSNHNLNHHLTWLAVFLVWCSAGLECKRREAA